MTLEAQVAGAMEAQNTKAMDTQDTDAMEAPNTKAMKMLGVRQNSWTKIVSIIIDYHTILVSKKAQASYYQELVQPDTECLLQTQRGRTIRYRYKENIPHAGCPSLFRNHFPHVVKTFIAVKSSASSPN